MTSEHRGSVASVGSTSAGTTTPPATQAPAHRAHHLKYGDVIASGFVPEDSDDELENNDTNDDNDDDHHSTGVGGDASSLSPSTVSSTSTRSGALPRDAKARHWRSMERQDALNRQLHESRRYLFRRPRALQYFRGNVLVRSEEERSSHRLELFFDLVFVGLIATLAEEAIHEHNGDAIVRYILTYTAAWMVWNYMREIFNAFFTDDLPQRVLVLGVMACLVVYGNNAPKAEEPREESGARATAIGAYLVAGGMVFGILTFYSFYICQYRIQIRSQAAVWLFVLALWIGSIFVSVRACIAMVTVALVLEYSSWMFFYSPVFKRLAKLRYSSAVAIEHEIDRFTDFVTLVHGEFLYSVLSGQPAGEGMHAGVARIILTVVVAFVLHGIYCTGAGSRRITHPIRRSVLHAVPYFALHLPLVSAITLCGDATAELVKENEVAQGIRWIFAATYAIGMVSTALLVMLEKEHDEPGELFFSKPIRIAPRFVAAIVVLLLPLAEQHHINSTALLGIAAALGGAAWLWQEFGALDGPHAPWYKQDSQAQTDAGQQAALPAGTRRWKGFPTLVEPGAWMLDSTKQRGRTTTFVHHESGATATAGNAAVTAHPQESPSKLSDL
ncbi:hypothetical protein EX895_000605 [Sporisorium graminicola]|uniref:Low temperature requirement protein A n=1 Tax=Sporisorium graminicola TaxID=280036 RepID=A0A4U7L1M5_9BASI|nr:hypothetical protein EX895_000605 [Sporisorium graminicola]TKY90607.1 hypothetical protein EX895_000605 [Sporisorium graminicola]